MKVETCTACGHQHTGKAWAYICIGCPCPETPGKPESVDEQGPVDPTCSRCHYAVSVRDPSEWTHGEDVCDECAQELVVELRAELAEAKSIEGPCGKFALQMRDERDSARAELARITEQRDALLYAARDVNTVYRDAGRTQSEIHALGFLRDAIAKAETAVPR